MGMQLVCFVLVSTYVEKVFNSGKLEHLMSEESYMSSMKQDGELGEVYAAETSKTWLRFTIVGQMDTTDI